MAPADPFSAAHRDLLLELSLLISERRGVDEIFASFSDHIRHGITFDFASLYVVTADPRFVRAVGNYPEIEQYSKPGIVERASDMGADRPELAQGVEYIPRKLDLPSTKVLTELGYQRAWVTSLLVDGTNYGMLTVAKTAHGAFPPEHIEFLKAAAQLLARAVRQDLELAHAHRNEARARAASELIFALQAYEPFDSVFQRLPALLGEGLEVDYVGLIIDNGEGFAVRAEAPAGVHSGAPPTAEGNARIRELAEREEFIQFRPEEGWSERLANAGYHRCAMGFLRVEQEVRGVLLLARRSGRKFDQDERHFVQLLQSILSQSLANQHRLERTEAAAARARTLNDVALLVNAGEDIDTIFQALLTLMEQAMDVDYVGLLEAAGVPGMFRMVGSKPEILRGPGALVPAEELGTDELIAAGELIFQYRPISLVDRTPFNRTMHEAGMQRAVTVILRQGATTEGVLALARRNIKRLTDDEVSFLRTLSAMLGQAIANHRSLRDARTEAARNKLLNDLAILLNNGEPPEAFFQSLSEQLKALVPFDGLGLLVTAEEPGTLRVVDSVRRQTLQQEERFSTEDFSEVVLRAADTHGDAVIEGDTLDLGGALAQSGREHGIQRGAISAIRHSAETLGFLVLGRKTNEPFTADERRFLALVSVLVGQAIANHRKVAEKEAEAIRSQVLSELAVILQGGSRIEDHFDSLSASMLQAVGFDFMSITIRDPATGAYRWVRSHDLQFEGEEVAFNPSSFDMLLRHGQASRQYQTAGLSRPIPAALFGAGFTRAATAVIAGADPEDGLLTIGRRDDVPFTEQELAFIDLVAALIGQASANYQKAHTREAEALRNRILSELALLLNNGEPIDAHFQRLREILVEGVGFDYCSVAVKRPHSDAFRILRSEEVLDASGRAVQVQAKAIDAILARGALNSQYGVEGVERGAPAGLFELGITRCASFILTTGTQPEGVLTIGRRRTEEFTPEEMSFFSVVASILSHAATNERRLTETTLEAEDQATLAETAAAVARENDAPAIVGSLQESVRRFIPKPFVGFGYLAGDRLLFRAIDGSGVSLPIGPDFAVALAEGQQTVQPSRAAGGTPEAAVEVDRIGLQAHVISRTRSRGETVGVLVVGSRDPSFVPGAREQRLCRLIADMVGPAMANARAAEREREEAEDQAIVAGAAAAIAREHDAAAIALGLREAVRKFIPGAFVRLLYLEPEGLQFVTLDGTRAVQQMGKYFRAALETGQSVVPATDLREAAGEDVRRSRAAGLQSHVLTRADSAGTPVGFLMLGSREPGFVPGERQVRLCRLIADIVGPAMANARAAERERAEAEEQAIIAEAAAAVAREADPLGMIRALRATVARFIEKPFVSFGYITDAGLRFRTAEDSDVVLPVGPYFDDAIRQGQRLVTRDEIASPSPEVEGQLRVTGVKASLLTLAHSAGGGVGVLVVGSRTEEFEPGPREARLCRLIADILGPAMSNALASETERREAEDQAIIAEAAAAVARETTPLTIVRGLRAAVGRFIPAPFVNFGYVEGDEVRFPSRTGRLERMTIATHFRAALEQGQLIVPSTAGRVAAGESLDEMVELGLEAHVLTRASSAGSVIGLLVIGSRDPRVLPDARELRLCRLIADIVGPAMANARAVERERIEAEEQRVIAEVSAVAAREADPGRMIAALRQPIAAIVPKPFLAFGYLEGETVVFPRPDGAFVRMPRDEYSVRTDEAGQVVWPEIPDQLLTDENTRDLGIRAFSSTAVRSGGSTVGYLLVGSRVDGYEFRERNLALIRLVAQIVGPAMENARATLRARADAEEQRILAEAAAAIAAGTSEAGIANSLTEPIQRFISGAALAVFFLDGETLAAPGEHGSSFGPQVAGALISGQEVVRQPWPEMSQLGHRMIEAGGIEEFALTAINVGGENHGVLFTGITHRGGHIGEREQRLLRLIADMAGPAFANARESARRQEEAQEQRILAEAAAAVARAADESALVAGLRAPIRMFIPESRVMLFYDEGDHLSVYGGNEKFPIGPQMRRALRGEQVAGSVADSGIVDESRVALEGQGFRRFVDTPIVSGGESLGVFFVATRHPTYTFSERDLRLFRLIAGFAGPAMSNLRESSRRKQEAEEQRILAEAAAGLAASVTELDVLNSLVAPIRRFVPRARVAFSYVEGDEMMLWDGRNRRPVHELSRIALETGQVVGDVETSPMTDASRDLIRSVRVHRFVDTAATSGGNPIGLLFVGTPVEDHEFSERDCRVLRLIADITGPAIANAREDRRRRDDAEDERILSEIAAVAARATRASEIVEGLPAALAAIVPDALALWGFTDADQVTYALTRPEHQAFARRPERTQAPSDRRGEGRCRARPGGGLARQRATRPSLLGPARP